MEDGKLPAVHGLAAFTTEKISRHLLLPGLSARSPKYLPSRGLAPN
jgi:hypothetical protein